MGVEGGGLGGGFGASGQPVSYANLLSDHPILFYVFVGYAIFIITLAVFVFIILVLFMVFGDL